MWMLEEVNFGAGSSTLHTACPGSARNLCEQQALTVAFVFIRSSQRRSLR